MIRKAMVGILLLALLLGAALPALADGIVSCSVTTEYVAVQVTPETADFGTLGWSVVGTVAGFSVENVGTIDQDLTVAGSVATHAGGTWALTSGSVAVNSYGMGVFADSSELRLVEAATGWKTSFAPEATQAFDLKLHMPASGSAGAGEVTMSVSFVATAS